MKLKTEMLNCKKRNRSRAKLYWQNVLRLNSLIESLKLDLGHLAENFHCRNSDVSKFNEPVPMYYFCYIWTQVNIKLVDKTIVRCSSMIMRLSDVHLNDYEIVRCSSQWLWDGVVAYKRRALTYLGCRLLRILIGK